MPDTILPQQIIDRIEKDSYDYAEKHSRVTQSYYNNETDIQLAYYCGALEEAQKGTLAAIDYGKWLLRETRKFVLLEGGSVFDDNPTDQELWNIFQQKTSNNEPTATDH